MVVVVRSAVIRKDDAFLMVKELKPGSAGKWGLPGGKLEEGESVYDTVSRELHEETGLTVTGHKLLGIVNKPKTHENNTVIRFIFLCSVNQKPAAPAEHEYAYLELESLTELESRGLIRGKEILPLLKKVTDGSDMDIDHLIQILQDPQNG